VPPVTVARLAKLDAFTGAALPWNAGFSNNVTDFELVGTGLVATGSFLTVNNQISRYLALVDANTANLIPWSVAPSSAPNGAFSSCARLGQALFATGTFSQYANQGRGSCWRSPSSPGCRGTS
jgi:hypothetical protein